MKKEKKRQKKEKKKKKKKRSPLELLEPEPAGLPVAEAGETRRSAVPRRRPLGRGGRQCRAAAPTSVRRPARARGPGRLAVAAAPAAVYDEEEAVYMPPPSRDYERGRDAALQAPARRGRRRRLPSTPRARRPKP